MLEGASKVSTGSIMESESGKTSPLHPLEFERHLRANPPSTVLGQVENKIMKTEEISESLGIYAKSPDLNFSNLFSTQTLLKFHKYRLHIIHVIKSE